MPFIFAIPLEPVRIALGMAMVLFSPGYSLLAWLYPRKGSLEGVERIALSLGLSLAIVPLLGLALNFTPWGIRLTPIVASTTLFALLFVAMAWRRRQRLVPEERFELKTQSVQEWIRRPRHPVQLALAAVVGLAVTVVIGITIWRVQHPPLGEPFTEFYVLGAERVLQNYPTHLQVGTPQRYDLGLVNRERQAITYRIEAFLDNELVGEVNAIPLVRGAKWEGTVTVVPAIEGNQVRLEFRLYRDGGSETYRTLYLFVDVGAQP